MRRVWVVLLILLTAFPVFCLTYSPRVEARLNAEFYHSSIVSESIPFRTSLNVNGDIVPLYFDSVYFGFGAGMTLSFTTRSLAFGHSIIKPYRALGAVIGVDWHVYDIFSLGLKSRLMFCTMGPVYVDKFAAVELELEPSFKVVDRNHFSVNVLVPLTAVFRKDGYCLRVGAGAGIAL